MPPRSPTTSTSRFADRERAEVTRTGMVLDLVTHDGCQTNFLVGYFGETRDMRLVDTATSARRVRAQVSATHRGAAADRRHGPARNDRRPAPRASRSPRPAAPGGALPVRFVQPRAHARQTLTAHAFRRAGRTTLRVGTGVAEKWTERRIPERFLDALGLRQRCTGRASARKKVLWRRARESA